MKRSTYIIVFLLIFFALGYVGSPNIEFMTRIGTLYYITKAQCIFIIIAFLWAILGYPIYLAISNKEENSLKNSIALAFGPAVIIVVLFLLFYLAQKAVSFILNYIFY